jgi:hypothetical protein
LAHKTKETDHRTFRTDPKATALIAAMGEIVFANAKDVNGDVSTMSGLLQTIDKSRLSRKVQDQHAKS